MGISHHPVLPPFVFPFYILFFTGHLLRSRPHAGNWICRGSSWPPGRRTQFCSHPTPFPWLLHHGSHDTSTYLCIHASHLELLQDREGSQHMASTEDIFKDYCKHGEEASEALSKEGLVLIEDRLGQYFCLALVLTLTSCVTLCSHVPPLCLIYNIWGSRESQRRLGVWKHLVKCTEEYRGTQNCQGLPHSRALLLTGWDTLGMQWLDLCLSFFNGNMGVTRLTLRAVEAVCNL